MNIYVRILSCIALLGTALLALSHYRPAWASRYGLDWWSLPEMHEQIRSGEQALLDKQADCEAVEARIAVKAEVIDALVAGRLTLAEAAARFRKLNASAGAPPTAVKGAFPGATEEERLCRQVISWTTCVGSYESAHQTRERLEAELGRLLAQDGGIRLPE
jgi:hypothetical protein